MGPADTLASMILGLITVFAVCFFIVGIPFAIAEIADRISKVYKFWKDGTWFSRSLFFVIPLLPFAIVAVASIFVGLEFLYLWIASAFVDLLYYAILFDIVKIERVMGGTKRRTMFFKDDPEKTELHELLRRADKKCKEYEAKLKSIRENKDRF